mgnify:CR=1 FL=1
MRERKLTVVDDKLISLFNMRRENQRGKELSRADVLKYLYEMHFPKKDTILTALCDGKNPPIQKLRKGVYMFNGSPVYKDRLQTALDTFYNMRKKNNAVVEPPFSEEEAIAYLKSKGYKIYRCIRHYEEV